MPESSDKGDRHDSAHSKPFSALGIKKIRMGKIVADLGEYRGLRVTRNTAGIRYLYRFRRSHSDKLIHGTLPGTLPRVITPTTLFLNRRRCGTSTAYIFRVGAVLIGLLLTVCAEEHQYHNQTNEGH